MAVPVRFTSGSILSAEMARRMTLRGVEAVAATDTTPVLSTGVEIDADDQAIVFIVHHDAADGVIVFSVQQSLDDDDVDAYENVTNGLVVADGTAATTVSLDAVDDGTFYILGINPLALTEGWVRLAADPDADYDGTAITVITVAGHPVVEA